MLIGAAETIGVLHPEVAQPGKGSKALQRDLGMVAVKAIAGGWMVLPPVKNYGNRF